MLKTRLLFLAVALGSIYLCSCETPSSGTANNSAPPVNTANAANTAKADPKTVEEIKELLAAHDKALNEQNIDAVVGTFSTDPKVVMLGTGQGERFEGQEAIRAAYTEILKDYDKGSFVPGCDWKTGGVDDTGKMAWLAATCDAKDSMKGKAREYTLNVTASAVKEPAGWRFIMLHMSNSTSGAPPPPSNTAGPPSVNTANTAKPANAANSNR